jgi:hypothetical protein
VHYTIETGIGDEVVPLVQVYPNPATDQLIIYGVRDAQVRIFSVDGKQVQFYENFSSNVIDVSVLGNGIYILHITTSEGNIIRKKIIVQ